MAITTQNLSYTGQGPVGGGSTILAFGGSSMQELSYLGTVTFTGDAGNSTTAILNYIDGVNALAFVPTAFLALRVGGNGTATVSVVSITDNADGGKTATVQFSAAIGNGNTLKMAVFVLK